MKREDGSQNAARDWQGRIHETSDRLAPGETAQLEGPVGNPEELVYQLVAQLNGNPGKPLEAFFAKDRQEGWIGIGTSDEFVQKQGTSFNEAMTAMEAWRVALPKKSKAFFSIPFDLEDTRPAAEWQGFLGVQAVVPSLLLHINVDGVRLTQFDDQKFSWSAFAQKDKGDATACSLRVTKSQTAPTKLQWLTWIADLRALFRRGAMKKVVAARRLVLGVERPIAPIDLLPRHKEKSGFFFFWQRETTCFTGQSPELLCDFQGEEMCTEALAGTLPRSPSPEEDQRRKEQLLGSAKDLHEQSVVADFLEERLGTYGRVSQAGIEIRTLEHLLHLQSRFRVRLHTFPSAGVVGVVHPTPAVSGFPQQDAMAYLRENEPFHRGLYAGALGVMSSRETLACVGIRSLLSRGCEVFLHTGAGIVAGSEPNAEWDEIEHKTRPLLEIFSKKEKDKQGEP
ncbi:MAG: isochorismate synthase [Deltaproteobacteria bacterium]|nr:isochorismate synthase [Deltaproteobacteria bacterium]